MTDRERELWEIRKADYRKAYEALIKLYPFTTSDLPGEIWRSIPDYGDFYQVSTFGRVKSLKTGKSQILKPQFDRGGYLRVNLYTNGKFIQFSVHKLVAETFIPNPNNLPEINHKDGYKLNNCVENLEWVSRSENLRHACALGLSQPAKGENHYKARLTAEQVIYIRENPDGLSVVELGKKFGVAFEVISNIQVGRIWKSVGGTIRKARKCKHLTNDERIEILRRYQKGVEGCGTPALAKEFGCSQAAIWNIVNDK